MGFLNRLLSPTAASAAPHRVLAANEAPAPTGYRPSHGPSNPPRARVGAEPTGGGETPLTYMVQPGDTFASIARRVLGDRERWSDLLAANQNQISNPFLLYPGTVLLLPRPPLPIPPALPLPPDPARPNPIGSFGDVFTRAPLPAPAPAPAPGPVPAPVPDQGSGPVLKLGASGESVKRLQERLGQLGFDPGSVDGAFGPKTDAAVKAFQQARGLVVDGIVGPATWNKLGITVNADVPPPAPEHGSGPVLQSGDSGEPAKRLQERLGQLGFDPGGVDGAFGPKTDAAVKAFQQARGLAVDGVVGPATWTKLGITVTGDVQHAAAPAGTTGGIVQTEDGPMTYRQGKMISPVIADRFDRMVAAAAKDGVTLQINDGYRTSSEQAVLYKLYKSGQGPIAAPPGQSMHNKGLAIDFFNRPGAFAWLKAHAAAFDMHNFAPEPWHYSTTGS